MQSALISLDELVESAKNGKKVTNSEISNLAKKQKKMLHQNIEEEQKELQK